jgi:hypothetical protein
MARKRMKILMVLTSHDKLGDTGKKTGFWLEEFAAPYYSGRRKESLRSCSRRRNPLARGCDRDGFGYGARGTAIGGDERLSSRHYPECKFHRQSGGRDVHGRFLIRKAWAHQGRTDQNNFYDFEVLRLPETPRVETQTIVRRTTEGGYYDFIEGERERI